VRRFTELNEIKIKTPKTIVTQRDPPPSQNNLEVVSSLLELRSAQVMILIFEHFEAVRIACNQLEFTPKALYQASFSVHRNEKLIS
jgi:hypothetical protein